MPEIAIFDLLIAGAGAFVLGVSKSGVKGIFILTVTLMAIVFGSKASTGIIIPLLIFADIIAVIYYNRHAQWSLLFKFLPWMILGVLIGVYLGKDIPEELFKKIMAVIIIFSVFMMFFWERRPNLKLSNNVFFSSSMGVMAGITTMIGNLAGAFSNIFFLSSRIPKNEFIGTSAWLFFIINLIKLPFHIFVWETVNVQSVMYDLYLIPFVVVGFIGGIRLVKLFKESFFRKFILFATALGAVLLLIS